MSISDPTEGSSGSIYLSEIKRMRLEAWSQLMMQAGQAMGYAAALRVGAPFHVTEQHNACLVVFLTTYAKCFQENSGRGVMLDRKHVFRADQDLLKVHERIMELRNQYAGHNDMSDVVEGGLYLEEDNGVLVVTPRHRTWFPHEEYGNFYNAAQTLALYTTKTYEGRLQKLAQRLGKPIKNGRNGSTLYPQNVPKILP